MLLLRETPILCQDKKSEYSCQHVANGPGKVQAPPVRYRLKEPEYVKGEPQPTSSEVLSLIVGPDGKPRDWRLLTRSARRSSQWVFKPAMCGGNPAPVMVNVEVLF